jgi:hypothetical protein
MSGTIVFDEKRDWSVSSGIFNWVIEFLAGTVKDEPTRNELRLIEEQNFRWLDLANLSEEGKHDVLAALKDHLVPHADAHFPDSLYREGALEVIRELAGLAKGTGPS